MKTPKRLSYQELTDEQRQQADALPYLLGRSIDEPLFTLRDGKPVAVNAIAEDQPYYGDYGYFCYECRVAMRKDEEHLCSGTGQFIYPVRTQEQAEARMALKTLREQYNEAHG